MIPTVSLPFIMILWTTKGRLFLKNKYLHNYNIPLRLAHVDGRSVRSASSFTFSNNAFNEDSYSDVFDPSFDIEKNVTVVELYKDELDVLQFNSELFSEREDLAHNKANRPKRKISPRLKLTLPRKKDTTPGNTTF